MTPRFCARAASVAAIGVLIFTAAPPRAAQAADGDANVETTNEAGKPLALTKARKAKVHKASRNRKAAKVAAVKADRKATPTKAMAPAEPQMPDAVANAHAQMPSTDTRGAATIGETPALEAAAAEQLSALGKSLTAPPVDEPQQIAQLAAPEPPQSDLTAAAPEPEPSRPLKQARVASASNDAWAQSSLIGKIFIAFGGMLTLASAARMLIA